MNVRRSPRFPPFTKIESQGAFITVPDSVTGDISCFYYCISLTSVTLGASVTSIGEWAFSYCSGLKGVYFGGNAPGLGSNQFQGADNVTVYYLPGTIGWGTMYAGRPTAFLVLPYPVVLTTTPSFGMQTNGFGFTISWATNAFVVVEACTDLANPNWTVVGINALADGSSYFSVTGCGVQNEVTGRNRP